MALTVIVPGVGAIPVVQLELALEPGVIVTVHVALGANVPVHVVGIAVMLVPVGSPVAETDSPMACSVPVFSIVMYRAFPVKAAFSPVLFTDNANIDGGRTLLRNVVAPGSVVRVITKTSLGAGW